MYPPSKASSGRSRPATSISRTSRSRTRSPCSTPWPPQHLHVEVQVAVIHAEPLRKLAVGQRPLALAAEHLEHSQPERMAESLELLGSLYRQNVAGCRRGGHGHEFLHIGIQCSLS